MEKMDDERTASDIQDEPELEGHLDKKALLDLTPFETKNDDRKAGTKLRCQHFCR